MGDRVPLADRALSEGFARLRYHDTSLLIWQQQQLELERAPPATYLNRSQSAWYSQYGNEAVLVRDRTRQEARGHTAASRICSLMCPSQTVERKPTRQNTASRQKAQQGVTEAPALTQGTVAAGGSEAEPHWSE
ncbi:hypothetical protein GN956_G19446 [Arapaima gigas]